MHFPTLFEFAVEAVTEGFNRGTISIPFCLDPRPSDAIYKELLRLNSEDIKILRNFKDILKITEIEVDCLETYDVLNLSSFSLKSLTLKNIANLRLKFPDREHKDTINVEQLLKTVLNRNSRNGLIHLGLRGSERLAENWVNEVS
ncbi:hypothetical protein GCK72_004879 [Caenorhabditis remanei]|uniref:Uncharacterized protein n=1 Tax=Caenorhabditis remanei TaxID=31234 RepID=A0A6A5HAX8_CAERE|nr:hypothetical protein GCK72_004879 [Caenorhabditis remanei]KAF1764928.1 hypothetical protein GCK72_004879 [Caenorhabditis remanei]